ncbi:MAG: hypothetical protein HY675_17185 [Chloroflexi bacterium]|nr:hypothetical protein [Chloroflexota bacterium]
MDSAKELGEGMVPDKRKPLIYWFCKRGVATLTEVRYDEITDKGLTVT